MGFPTDRASKFIRLIRGFALLGPVLLSAMATRRFWCSTLHLRMTVLLTFEALLEPQIPDKDFGSVNNVLIDGWVC